MPNDVKHFSINADNVSRAKKFYEQTFGWQFSPWGPPDFFLIQTGSAEAPGLHGGLQKRREIVKGKPMYGLECTLGVADIDKTIAAVEANGGKIVMPKFHIPTVGLLIYFEDPEGNIIGAMQYENEF
ncbi:MAG TPA: VOC family protein [Pyrinomonadaceae bacterium]